MTDAPPEIVPDKRPVLLAMNNPVSSDPAHALYPHPPGCAGARLCAMFLEAGQREGMQVGRHDYLRVFDRRNVLAQKEWSRTEARAAGGPLWAALGGRTVVVLGAATAAAVGAPRLPLDSWGSRGDVTYCCLPHPSGRCLEYNDPETRALAGRVLLDLYWRYENGRPLV